MDYLPTLIGLRVGSEEFRLAIEELQAELIQQNQLAEDDVLKVEFGHLGKMKQNKVPHTDELHSIYPDEQVLTIRRSSDDSLLYIKRITEAKNHNGSEMEKHLVTKDNTTEEKLFYVLPRYEGFVAGNGPYSREMMYYLQITLERFIGQNRMIYASNFESMKEENSHDIRTSLACIRKLFNERHGFVTFHDEKLEQSYYEITHLLAKVVYIRASPLYDKSLETVIEEAFTEKSSLPTVLNDPNQITEIGLRMTVLAISAIISDLQRYEKSHSELELFVMEDSLTTEVNSYAEEADKIWRLLTTIVDEYTPEMSDMDRYHLDAKDAKSFERMYKETFGDLYKIASICSNPAAEKPATKRNPNPVRLKDTLPNDEYWQLAMARRMTWCNTQLFQNRISKIGDCFKSQEELSVLAKTAKHTHTALNEMEVPALLKQLFFYARQTVGTSASDEERFGEAMHKYTSFHALMQGQAEKMLHSSHDNVQNTGDNLCVFLEKIDGIVDSKRKSNTAVNLAKEAFFPAALVKARSV